MRWLMPAELRPHCKIGRSSTIKAGLQLRHLKRVATSAALKPYKATVEETFGTIWRTFNQNVNKNRGASMLPGQDFLDERSEHWREYW